MSNPDCGPRDVGGTCAPPVRPCAANGQLQVAAGMRGNADFARRDQLQGCFDAAILKMCDPRTGNSCSQVLADGVATCQRDPRTRPGMGSTCVNWINAGFVDPSTASVHRAEGLEPGFSLDATSGLCALQNGTGSIPSVAQACVEDLDAAQLRTAGQVPATAPTHTSNVPRSVFVPGTYGPDGRQLKPPSYHSESSFTYKAPAVGRNAPMRMSRVPVFFDATRAGASQYLQQAFVAVHARWDVTGALRDNDDGGGATPWSEACAAGHGGGTTWWNGGLRKENIYLASRAAQPDGSPQQVLCLRFQGDRTEVGGGSTSASTGESTVGVPGLGAALRVRESDVANLVPGMDRRKVQCETCSVFPQDATHARRVGSTLATAHKFGSGLVEVFARVPPGNHLEDGGLGYVFGLWTQHQHRTLPLYTPPASVPNAGAGGIGGGWLVDPAGQQLPGNLVPGIAQVAHLEAPGMNRFSCGLMSRNCDGGAGPHTQWRHSVGMFVPSNSARLPRSNLSSRPPVPASGMCGWGSNTMSLSTWLGDDGDASDASPGRNVGVRQMANDVASSGSTSFTARTQQDFHWFSFVWCSGSDKDNVAPYVDFYFDRRFVQRFTDTFIPSRAGRAHVGPLFEPQGGIPDFGAKEVWIKYMNVVPFAAVNDPMFGDAPASTLSAQQLARWWEPAPPKSGASTGLGPRQPTKALPRLTASKLDALYLHMARRQRDAPPPPPTWRIRECDIQAAHNDINAPQLLDQCGTSKVRNVCDYNAFVAPQGLPGQVVGAHEPLGCPGAPTAAQRVQIRAGGRVETTLNPTLHRPAFFNIHHDPDPDMGTHVAPKFPMSAFPQGQDGAPAVLNGDPSRRSFCTAATAAAPHSAPAQLASMGPSPPPQAIAPHKAAPGLLLILLGVCMALFVLAVVLVFVRKTRATGTQPDAISVATTKGTPTNHDRPTRGV